MLLPNMARYVINDSSTIRQFAEYIAIWFVAVAGGALVFSRHWVFFTCLLVAAFAVVLVMVIDKCKSE